MPGREASAPIRVLIVDDHRLVREGLRISLESDARFEVVGECGDGESVVPACETHNPEVVVLDISLPGISGLEVARHLRRRSPSTRVVILTMHEEMGLVREAKLAGAAAFLPKSAGPGKLRAMLANVAAGRLSFPRSLGAGRALSAREREVLSRIAAGDDSRTIAELLGLSVRTVEKHRENLSKKLKVKGAAALTKYALLRNLAQFGTQSA